MTTSQTTISAITQKVRRTFAKFPHVVEIHQRFDALREYQCISEEPESIALVGVSGIGKSSLIQSYLRKHPRIEHDEFTEIPIVYAEVPAKCTIKKLATILLRAIGSPMPLAGDEEDRTHQFVQLVSQCKVRLIILDEVNHLVDRGSTKTHYMVADWIKQLINSTKVPVVLAGTTRVRDFIQTNEQLASRFSEVIEIEPFSVAKDSKNKMGFALSAYASSFAGIPTISLSDPDVQRRFAFATGGRLRPLSHLLTRAIEIGGTEKGIQLSTLATAFEKVIFDCCPPKRNPFRPDFDGIPLNKLGEPFCPSAVGTK